jgi:hypothetical protein
MTTGPLATAIRNKQAILFVGSGASRGIGLPSWEGLMDEMAATLGYDPAIFKTHGGYLELAEYYQIQQTTLGPLRSWMDRTWHNDESRVDTSRLHQLIVDLEFPVTYTTNYDRWIEIAFARRNKDYVKVANVGDFAKLRDGVPQIVKLHGDFDDDSSLVLTETSYFERLAFESPLDIKLRSDSLGKTILFIGYSLSDINIRYLLYKLHRLWADSSFASARPQSFIYLNRPNPIHEAILSRRGIIPLVSDDDDPGRGLVAFLDDLVHAVRGTISPAAVL